VFCFGPPFRLICSAHARLVGFSRTKPLIIRKIPDSLTIPFAEQYIQAEKEYLRRALRATGGRDALLRFLRHSFATFDRLAPVHGPHANRLKGFYVNERRKDLNIPRCGLSRAGWPRSKNHRGEAEADLFSQGDAADSVFYLQEGQAKLTVVPENGKEATIALLSAGDFIGEESLAAVPGLRLFTATASSACVALVIGRDEMIRVMHEEYSFSDVFLSFLLARSMRTQADLIDQLFNSSEKRPARILLLMAEFGKPG
jgi:Cyclic nucleotide-binding domain